MDMEEKYVNKILYKIELLTIKIIPILLAFINVLNIILSYFGYDLVCLSYIGGISFLTLFFLYLSSFVFKFCIYHRMFLHYITINCILNTIDYYYNIPISDRNYLSLQLIIFFIIILISLILYVRHNKRIFTKNNK